MNVTQTFLCDLLAVGPRTAGFVLPRSIDWDDFEAATRTFRGYTSHRIDLLGLGNSVPEGVAERIAEGARLEVLIHVQRESLLKTILLALHAQGIETCLLKGAALQRTVYPRSELRPMSDLDLWVPGADLDVLTDVLSPFGFQVPLRFAAAPPKAHVRVLERPGSPTLVELHHHPEPLDRFWSNARLEEIWARTRSVDVGDVATRVMASEDALVHVCLHASIHHEFDLGIRPILDAALLVASTDVDWVSVAARAGGRADLGMWLDVTLRVARDVFGASVPESFLVDLGSGPSRGEMADIARELTLSHRLGSRHSFVGQLATIPTLRGRARAIAARLTSHYADSDLSGRMARPFVDVLGKGPRHLRRLFRGGYSARELESRRIQTAGWEALLELRDREREGTDP